MNETVEHPLHICVIGSTFPLSNNDPQVPWLRESLRRLCERGHRVTVLAPAYGGTPSHQVDDCRVIRFRYAPASLETLTHDSGAPNKIKTRWQKLLVIPYLLSGCFSALLLASRERVDVIHAHWPFPHGVISGAMRLACGAPVILTCHGAELALGRKSGWIRQALGAILRSHALLCCNSTHTRNEIRKVCGRHAMIFPYGTSIQITPRTDKTSTAFHDPVRLLFCGRLIERKGIPYLLDALSHLRQKHTLRLDITGEGNCKDAWISRTRELGLDDIVTFHGFVDNETLAHLYGECDIYVHPAIFDSRGDTEGLGVVLIEALANEKPVVASAVGGIVDVIRHEQSGLLVPEKDPLALVASIERLIADPALAKRLGQQGREHMLQVFDWDTITRRSERLYRRAVANCRGHRLWRRHISISSRASSC